MDLLVQGVYDIQTLKTLQQQNISALGFDLRGKSLNLIAFHVLKNLIPHFKLHKNFLIFENDKVQTIISFLNLLGEDKNKFDLEFRDHQSLDFYSQIDHPFAWYFSTQTDWKSILELPKLKTLFLPIDLKQEYEHLSELWSLVQRRHLRVVVHTSSFFELEKFKYDKNLYLSVDLGKEMENGFRQIDQVRLTNHSIWKNLYESASGQ